MQIYLSISNIASSLAYVHITYSYTTHCSEMVNACTPFPLFLFLVCIEFRREPCGRLNFSKRKLSYVNITDSKRVKW